MTRYGFQEGAAVGYNPAKRGRALHHRLTAFVLETRMMANFWLRPAILAAPITYWPSLIQPSLT